jgi:hypothetical protein
MSDFIGNGPEGGLDFGNLAGIRWTDKSFPATASKLGIQDKPDFNYTELGLLFPFDDTAEKIYILDQMWHTKKLDTPLRLHIHFLQDSVNLPNFVCEYRFYNNGATIPGWTTIKTDDGAGAVFTFVATPFVNLIQFPEIPAPVNEKISAILDMKIWRDDTNIAGDVLTKYVDYHFQVDASGSRQEFTK